MFGGCLVLIGLVMAVGGLNLVILGGSTYYLVASLFLSVSGYLLLQGRRRSGAWVYVAALALTIAWALFEVGLDFWLLIPRVDGPLAIGLILLIFWARAPLGRRSLLNYHKPLGVSSSAAVCVTVLVAVAVIGYFFLTHWPSSLATEPILEPAAPIDEEAREWRHYGNTLKGQRYARLAQLTPANISKLQVAWTYRTGEMPRDDDPLIVTFEATPIKIHDTLYLCSPRNVVIALDAETGQQRWRYDPRVQIAPSMAATCRGVSFHEAAPRTMSQCRRRIIFGTGDARLIALDADSGELCSEFGENGVVDLRRGLGEVKAGQYAVTSAPTIVGDIAIVGAQIPNKNVSDGPSGVVRAFNVITGALVWNWDSARPDKTTPLGLGESYTRSSPNSWGTQALTKSSDLFTSRRAGSRRTRGARATTKWPRPWTICSSASTSSRTSSKTARLSNNAAERELRGIALGRKSWLFAGSDRGGERAAIMLTLIQTARLNDVDPQAWLADVLGRIANHKITDLAALLPWNWRCSIPVDRAA
jgi:quinoprotein glucose dehydrogenase